MEDMMSRDTLIALSRSALEGPDRDAFAERDAAGQWQMLRSNALLERVCGLAMGLRAAGVAPGDRVALMSPNRVDWIVTNLAIVHAGAVLVPIYATQAHDQVAHILADSEARLLVVDTPATRDALVASAVALPRTLVFDDDGSDSTRACESAGNAARIIQPDALAQIAAGVRGDDLAVLIYTSGTTGQPKGVMLTHGNIVANARDAFSLIGGTVGAGDPVLSILPYAHIYEHANLYGYLIRHTVVYVNRKMEALLEDLRAVRPAMVFAVPRVFERMLVAMLSRAKAQGGLHAKIVPWALGIGRDYMRAKSTGAPLSSSLRLQYALAHVLALKKIRPTLGLDRLRFFGSGSAPLHPDTGFTFLGFDVAIAEGYGLTECSPVVTANRPINPTIGTVGTAIPNVELRIADDGELLVRGPNVMKGYYRDPVATAAVIVDGWFHTGDIATIDAAGSVRITDRKKELFKTSGGKFIAPSRVESAILRSIYVNQVMVFGNGRPHPAALVSPNWANVRREMELADDLPSELLARRADVHAFMQKEVLLATADLATFEQIRWIGVLPRDLTIEDGELSPTQKIKRRVVEDRYAELIGNVFAAVA